MLNQVDWCGEFIDRRRLLTNKLVDQGYTFGEK